MHPGSSLRPVFALLLATSAITSALQAQSIAFNDTFADGERATQNLPSSVAWYLGQTAPGLSVRNGVLEVTAPGNAGRTFWAYFPVVSLKVGEAITFTFDFSYTGSFGPDGSALRVGLCYTNGVAPRTSDGPGPTGNYQGYASIGFTGGSTGLRKRNGPGASSPTSAVINNLGDIWNAFGTTPNSPKASQLNTPYTGTLKVVRTGADTATVTSSFTGGNLTGSSTITLTDASNIFTNFDTVIFNFPGETLTGTMLIRRASLIVTSLPTVTTQPVAQASSLGTDVTFTAGALGNPAPAWQWQRRAAGSTVWANITDGGAYAGATTPTLKVASVTGAMEGDQFRAFATNSVGAVFTDPATLTLSFARLVNLSVLASLASAGDSFTLGYVVGGSGTGGTKSILARAAGPSLAPLGVTGAVDDPRLELFAGASKTSENDDWGGTATLSNAFNQVGAFAFAGATSRDAAALASVSPGDNSVRVSASETGTGLVIAEIYDSTAANVWTAATPRLINVSILKHIGPGLTAGFVIGGNRPQTVMIRAIGPTLGAPPFNLTDVAADPRLELFAGALKIGENDDWGGTPALGAAFARVGAFALPANSRDAAILATLAPGSYSAVVTGTNNTTGVAIVEIYEVP